LLARVQQEFSGARIVHRLDRDTSGLIVMALDADTHRALSAQFRERSVEKRYVAVVLGVVADESGQLDAPLVKDFDNPPRHKVDYKLGRPAQTAWRVIERHADRTRLELVPHTGRSHQLRIHCLEAGHPILGDLLYAPPAALAMADRLLLHAEFLSLLHPASGEQMVWHAPCPF
jgi:tRNA pseudouridine32 synthase/23S rRNA pseudouridine746 synthase